MSAPRASIGSRLRRLGVRLLLAAAAVGGVAWVARELGRPARPTLDGLSFVPARRVDLRSVLSASGTTESASNTVIECKLERVTMRSEGQSSSSGGSSTILWIVEDGTEVKKGDLLCSLDASDYEELVRQQEIKVERAKADLVQAQLTYESSRMGVDEYRKGLIAQNLQDFEGKLKLAEADIRRAADRLAWSSRMIIKGYVSQEQVANDTQAVRKGELAVTKARWALDNFRKFGAPMEVQLLLAEVENGRTNLLVQEQKHSRFAERLAYYKKMVENCTIRAPHDGFVIYAEQDGRFGETKLEAGATVRQMQDLFLLPDLSKMQINTLLHESIVTRIRPGMTVRARIEGMSNRELEGHVVKVDPLPDEDAGWFNDTKLFHAIVRLDHPPRGIRPEMTAEVEIDVDRRDHVIAIPAEALAVVGGKGYCYVAADGALERRQVKLGGSNREMLEVVEGLEEGEAVVSDLAHIDAYAPLITDAPLETPAPAAAGHTVAAAHARPAGNKAGL